ncbi:hypothetical protein [Actinomycetospora termitidis]|uniref:SH3 domain-containing protein n=1 Tax=Actinomycetospora termitidis TaxID=3053470 RepID=A0ABT7M4G2_9PSEU|nr:hypothetical protein [Actinomycetospora sp. Odt1-22]MDL5155336.1 hypothetical protein [Actinomycetospora sp. Odt1-22]
MRTPRPARRRRVLLPALIATAVLLLGGAMAAVGAPPSTPGVVSPGVDAQTWRPELAGDAVNVQVAAGAARLASPRDGERPGSLRGAQRRGLLDLGTHTFARPVNRLAVPVVADVPAGSAVTVDVRGRDDAGRWSEWTPAAPGEPAVLDAPARTVALRLTLVAPAGPSPSSGPTVRSVTVHADRDESTSRTVTPRASYRVFATREGLVGGTTANGHVITEHDMFVALPSRRALDADRTGDYSVRVCGPGGKCAIAPVWDVGPWNVGDDYWNAAPPREQWGDLPQGTPQAQAAHDDGYHDGEDGFGREVANPAGIDLADGVFEAVGLSDNGWVTVDYLWTGQAGEDPADVHLATADSPDAPVAVRASPSAAAAQTAVVGNAARLDVQCRASGETVSGRRGDSADWLRIDTVPATPEAPAGVGWVPAAWMATDAAPPAC